MSAVVHARVTDQLTRLRLRYVAERLDAVLNDAARTEPTYLDFLDAVLQQEVDANARRSNNADTGATWTSGFSSVVVIDNEDLSHLQERLWRRLGRGARTAAGSTRTYPSARAARSRYCRRDLRRRRGH